MGATNIGVGGSAPSKRAEPSSSVLITFARVLVTIAFIGLISNDLSGEPRCDHLHLRQVVASAPFQTAPRLGPPSLGLRVCSCETP
jgi:hypothetical protein